MSSTNKTTNYELTQFLATDVPSWLVDYNGDMSKIDTQMHANAVAAAAASTDATTAGNKADAAVADVTALEAVIETPNTGVLARMSSAENDINTIQSLIGNGEPTTTDKTIIGAINELNGEIGDVKAEDVSFVNTGTDLVSTDVESAIKEVNNKVNPVSQTNKIMILTDSYGAVVDGNGKTFAEVVADTLGCTVDMIAESGASAEGGTLLSAVTAYTGDTDHNYFIIFAGANDVNNSHTVTAIKNGVKDLIDGIKAKFTSAKILVMPIGTRFNGSFTAVARSNVAKAYKLAAISKGVKYITNSEYVLRNTSLLNVDTVHPNASGVDTLASAIIEALDNGFVDVNYVLECTGITTETTAHTYNYVMIRHNGQVKINSCIGNGLFVPHNDSTTYDGTAIDLATFSETLVEIDTSSLSYGLMAEMNGVASVSSARTPARGLFGIVSKKLVGRIVYDPNGGSTATNMYLTGDLTFFD